MQRLLAVALPFLLISCASEADRYAWNRTHPHLCPNARWLTANDIDQIAHILARATPQTIMAISAADRPHRKLHVTTCYRGALEQESPDRNVFGFCTLERDKDTWKVTYVGTDLSPSLAFALACDESRQ
jgi:hypothetical protein